MTPKTRDVPSFKLMVGATGVVFGDIGTSPLYALKESFTGHHGLPVDEFHVLSVLSMLVWALILVVTLKYVLVIMRADNRGEGGSLALLALIGRVAPHSKLLPILAGAALMATALFYGDAVITPAISILSAVEGLTLLNPALATYVIPVTLTIVVALFAAQRFGTEVVGGLFGPVMIVWFVTLGVMGAVQIGLNPIVLKAVNPAYAFHYIYAEPSRAFFTLGTVVLAVTGAEALYADMGHFSRKAITRAWLMLALPGLLLCYAGQSALVLRDPAAIQSPFFLMVPQALLIPLLALATVATVIASQSIISGAFSVTRQAVLLGYLPRIRFFHTSKETHGQVYAPLVNGLLMATVIALVLTFKTSSGLAAAYGLAVTATMVLTTLMIGFVIFRIWRWNPLLAAPVYFGLLALDLGLFASSATKFADGGYLPIGLAALVVLVFATWRKGCILLARQMESDMSVAQLLAATTDVPRVPATAIYLTSNRQGMPPALLQNLKCNRVLHAHVLLVTVETALEPFVDEDRRTTAEDLGNGFLRVVTRHGFAEKPNVPVALATLREKYPWFELDTAAYFLSRQTMVPTDKPGMALWREHLFAAMVRNTETPIAFFQLPLNRVVELGSQVEI